MICDRIPTGATAGIPFKLQPQVAFVDTYLNPIEALDGNPMIVKLHPPDTGELLGSTELRSTKGIAYFTDLAITLVGTYWLEFQASGYSVFSSTFTVVHGRAAAVAWIEQPTTTSSRAVFVPQPLAQLWDVYANMVLLPYAFKARVFHTRRDGGRITHGTHVECQQCGGFYESHEFFSEDGYIRFSDLSVVLSPDGPTNEFGLALELIAVNLTACENIGDNLLCGPDTEYINDGQVLGLTEYFDLFTITRLKI